VPPATHDAAWYLTTLLLLVRDCLFVVLQCEISFALKYTYFAANLYLETMTLSATWDTGGSRQMCNQFHRVHNRCTRHFPGNVVEGTADYEILFNFLPVITWCKTELEFTTPQCDVIWIPHSVWIPHESMLLGVMSRWCCTSFCWWMDWHCAGFAVVVVLNEVVTVICCRCCQCREDGLHSVPSGTNRGCPCMFACLCRRTGLSRLTLVYASCHLPEVCTYRHYSPLSASKLVWFMVQQTHFY